VELGLFRRQLGLEALLGIERPGAYARPNAGPNDAKPNAGADHAGADDAGADDPVAHAIPAGPDTVLGKLLKLV